MRLRTRLLVLSVSTVAMIVTALVVLHVDSLTRTWLDTAVQRSDEAGKQIESLIALRVSESRRRARRNLNQMVADDPEIGAMLVQQTAVQLGSIVEINIIGQDGRIVLSSNPSVQGQDAIPRESLAAVRDSGLFGRLVAILQSRNDYGTRIRMGSDDQSKPVFEIQILVSPVLLRDKMIPDLEDTGLVSLLALLAAVGLAGVAAHLALVPVRRIGRAIDSLSTGRPLGLTFAVKSREDREVEAIEYKLSLLGEKMHGARRDAIGTLVRTVAHEIKNPLNAISLRLETLRMRLADEAPEAEPDVDLVSNEVQRLDRVVRTFLDLNQPMELNLKEFDPAQLAATVLEIMRPAAEKESVKLELAQPASPFTVQADRGLIEQGLLNIVKNAIQAMPAGGMVKTSVSQANGNCVVAVSDNGPGMPASVRDRIFEPYYTTKAGGSGIGLAITRRAMELHHGSISVESSPGLGTTMILSFPVRLLLTVTILLFTAGCFMQKAPTVSAPTTTPPTPAATPAPLPAPEPATVTLPPPVPAPVVVAPPQPSAPATGSAKPSPFPPVKPAPAPTPPPALGTILTTDQRKQLDTAYQTDLRETNKLLTGFSGRTLTPQQTDTVNRARSFLHQAAQYHNRDLSTAAELAHRARVLTQDLAAALK